MSRGRLLPQRAARARPPAQRAARARAWLAVAVLGLAGVLMLGVFPARALMAQHAERRQVAARIKVLDSQNRNLEGRAEALETDAEIERLARQHYDLVRPGEEVFDIVAPPSPAGAQHPDQGAAADNGSPGTGAGAGQTRSSVEGRGTVHRILARLTDVF